MVNIFRSAPASPADDDPTTGLEVDGVSFAYNDHLVLDDVSLDVASGEILALLGPSGCGKTTLLRSIAGLDRPRTGSIRLGGRTLTDHRTSVSPERRRIGMVFQDGALFPHLTVRRNVAYGLPLADRRSTRVDETLELVGLGKLADRMPGTLSGGQQQRVAVARALAPQPTMLLLDEPFSSLDTALRVSVRTEIHRLLADLGITTVFVTHDQEEAFVLGDRVAVLHEGRMAQIGTPDDLYRRPANPWVATFVGDANLFASVAHDGGCVTPVGVVPLATATEGAVQVLVRPEDLAIVDGEDAVVELIEYYGHDAMAHLRFEDRTSVRVRTHATSTHHRGDQVGVTYVGSNAVAFEV